MFFLPFSIYSGVLGCVPLIAVNDGSHFNPYDAVFKSALHDLTLEAFHINDSFDLIEAQEVEATIADYVRRPDVEPRMLKFDRKTFSIYPKYAQDKAAAWTGDPELELHKEYIEQKMATSRPFAAFCIDPRLTDPQTVS